MPGASELYIDTTVSSRHRASELNKNTTISSRARNVPVFGLWVGLVLAVLESEWFWLYKRVVGVGRVREWLVLAG